MVHGVPMVPFPGLSVLSCVPTAIKLSSKNIEAGLIAVDARPAVLARPYLNLKPPFLEGCEKTGLPAITSPIYFEEGKISGMQFSSFLSFLSLCTKISRKSHPLSFSFFTCFKIFGAFKHRPSAITKQAPPLNLLVPTLGRSL